MNDWMNRQRQPDRQTDGCLVTIKLDVLLYDDDHNFLYNKHGCYKKINSIDGFDLN